MNFLKKTWEEFKLFCRALGEAILVVGFLILAMNGFVVIVNKAMEVIS